MRYPRREEAESRAIAMEIAVSFTRATLLREGQETIRISQEHCEVA